MKKTMLLSTVFTLLCAQVQADTQTTIQTQAPTTNSSTTTTTTTQTPSTTETTPAIQTTSPQPSQNEQPATTSQIPSEQQPLANINCEYKIPAETKTIAQSLVLAWSEKAVTQAFDFYPSSIDTQLQKLQACFTEQGWTGFNTALQKSGNLDAIKAQHLTVSSQVDGQSQVAESTDNTWKITLPLQVVYQNDKEKVTQLLNVNLNIARKPSGDLGITQLIATPRSNTPQEAQDANSKNVQHSDSQEVDNLSN